MTVKIYEILPVVVMVEAFLAVIPLILSGKYASALYWFSAGTITLSVILMSRMS